MTVIAAVARDGKVFMGCDTAADYSGSYVYKQEGKVAELQTGTGGKLLIAAAGSASLLPVIARNLKIESNLTPRHTDDEADSWADSVVAAITGVAADCTPSLLTSGDSPGLDGTVLFAWDRHVWFMFAHSAIRPSGGVVAIGSGTDVAVGAMNAALQFGAEPKAAVVTAVELACKFADGCRLDERGPLLHTT